MEIMKYSNELEFEKALEKYFLDIGYLVDRQCVPDQCKDWEKPYKIDMIIKKKDQIYAFELKNIKSLDSGRRIKKNIQQILKYKNKTYTSKKLGLKNKKIHKWGLFYSFKKENVHNIFTYFIINIFKHIFDLLDIGIYKVDGKGDIIFLKGNIEENISSGYYLSDYIP